MSVSAIKFRIYAKFSCQGHRFTSGRDIFDYSSSFTRTRTGDHVLPFDKELECGTGMWHIDEQTKTDLRWYATFCTVQRNDNSNIFFLSNTFYILPIVALNKCFRF